MPLPEPVGRQREVVTLNHLGHTGVLGTAGSGKTTMAVHRAVYLSNNSTPHGGPTLLLSFNKSLLAYLSYLRPPELEDVDICTYHRFACGYLAHRGKMGSNWICRSEGKRRQLIGQALAQVRGEVGTNSFIDRPLQFFVAEVHWIAQQGLTSAAEYAAVDRVGRGDEGPLQPAQRALMFKVYEAYRQIRGEAGYRYDWDDVATAVSAAFAADGESRKYRHIVIDEGQDFSPAMLRSLALAIPPDGSLTFFGDVAQQVYGRRISWRQAGLDIKTPWRFKHNYRNSRQIADVGLAIAAMPYFADEPDMVTPTEFAAAGPKPALVRCGSKEKEIEFVIERARAASESASVAILVRRHQDEAPFARAFGSSGRLHRDMTNWTPDPGVSYGCVHNAKGYEFNTVILAGLGDEHWPDPRAVTVEGESEAEASDGRLLYVGVTRAQSALIMTHTGPPTRLLPENDDLWTETRLGE